jgi:hypothetical protein
MTYAVVWRINDGSDCTGRLELVPGLIQLAGVDDDATDVLVNVLLDDLDSVLLERDASPRCGWEPAVVLVTRGGDRLAIGSLEGLGALHELAESIEFTRHYAAA